MFENEVILITRLSSLYLEQSTSGQFRHVRIFAIVKGSRIILGRLAKSIFSQNYRMPMQMLMFEVNLLYHSIVRTTEICLFLIKKLKRYFYL